MIYTYILAGNANTGKTTVFNQLTHAHNHTGNWLGVTVDVAERKCSYQGKTLRFADLPGIYSLSAASQDEKNAVCFLQQNKGAVVLNVVDANNLRRNLYLTLELLEKGFQVKLLINFYKSFCQKGKLDIKKLAEKLGIDIIIFHKNREDNLAQITKEVKPVKKKSYEQTNTLKTAQQRYTFIDQLLKDCYIQNQKLPYGASRFDKILLNKFFALPIFLACLLFVFYLAFGHFGSYCSITLNKILHICLINPIFAWLAKINASAFLLSLFKNGIFTGLTAVLGFLPQVLILFMALTVIEDSGYLARLAFVSDDFFEKIGLTGKSVFTILLGFGCATGAIETVKAQEDQSVKIKTAMVTPLLPCMAKLPVISVLVGALVLKNSFFLLFGIYMLSCIICFLMAWFLNGQKELQTQKSDLILEFPSLKKISFKRLCTQTAKNMFDFLLRVASIVVLVNILLWILFNFSFSLRFLNGASGSILDTIASVLAPVFTPLGFSSSAAVVAIIAGIFAKELIVSTLCSLNNVATSTALTQTLLTVGSVVYFTKAGLASFVVFCLFYSPCAASMAAIKKNVPRKYFYLTLLYHFVLAYSMALITYFLFRFVGVIFIVYLAVALFLLVCFWQIRKKRNKTCGLCTKCKRKCL